MQKVRSKQAAAILVRSAPEAYERGRTSTSTLVRPPCCRGVLHCIGEFSTLSRNERTEESGRRDLSTQLILKVVGGPFGELSAADVSRLVYWIDPAQSLIVGRSAFGTDVAVRNDPRMSGTHFKINCDGGHWRVQDLGSTHGTYVSGDKVQEAELFHGDIIRAGDTTFQADIPELAPPADNKAGESPAALAGPVPNASLLDNSVQQPSDSAGLAEPVQLVLKIESGPFGEVEFANLSRVLNWISAGQSIVIGRNYESDMVIRQDSGLSSRHFEVVCDSETCTLRDLDSSNGTLLNGETVTEAQLRDGDKIRASETVFGVSIMGGAQLKKSDVADDLDIEPSPEPEPPTLLADKSDMPLEPMQVVLTIDSGPFSESEKDSLSRVLTWFGAGQTIVVGRSASASDLRIRYDKRLSGKHFAVQCDGSHCRLRDLQSANGTFLNDERVTEALLRDDDTIRAGETSFRIKIQGGAQVSDVEAEFAAVNSVDETATPEAPVASPTAAADLDGVFAGIKAKLRSRR